jgi:hypothetical protein
MLNRTLGSVFLLVPTLGLFEIAGRLAAEQRAGRGMSSEPGVGQDLRESVDGRSRQTSEDIHGVHEGIDVIVLASASSRVPADRRPSPAVIPRKCPVPVFDGSGVLQRTDAGNKHPCSSHPSVPKACPGRRSKLAGSSGRSLPTLSCEA